MQSIQEVNQAIMFGGWTNEELESMISAIKFKRALKVFGKLILRFPPGRI